MPARAVHGLGGVGKTRAAVEYAWRFQDDYSALLFLSAPSAGDLRSRLADLVGVLAIDTAETTVDARLAEVLHWLDDHPGWLLIVDNVDTEDAAREVQKLLASLTAGHVLITSRIAKWRAGVEPLDLHLLPEADAVAFLLERTTGRRRKPDDTGAAAAIARELDGLALALEQAGAYVNTQHLSLAEYRLSWESKRAAVLGWHDELAMGYPASVAVTWVTTFDRLGEPERALLRMLSWLAPDPIPLNLFDVGSPGGGHCRPPRGTGGPLRLLTGTVLRRKETPIGGPSPGTGDHAASRPGRGATATGPYGSPWRPWTTSTRVVPGTSGPGRSGPPFPLTSRRSPPVADDAESLGSAEYRRR